MRLRTRAYPARRGRRQGLASKSPRAGGGEGRGQVPSQWSIAAVRRSDHGVGAALDEDDEAHDCRAARARLSLSSSGLVTSAAPSEQARELAPSCRGQHGLMSPRAMSAASRCASPAKLDQRMLASSTMVRRSAGLISAAATSLRKVGPTPAPGPSAIARRRSSLSKSLELPCASERGDHHRCQMRGVDCDGV